MAELNTHRTNGTISRFEIIDGIYFAYFLDLYLRFGQTVCVSVAQNGTCYGIY